MTESRVLSNYCSVFQSFITNGKNYDPSKDEEYKNTTTDIRYDDAIKEIRDILFELKDIKDRHTFISTIVTNLYSCHKGGYHFNIFNIGGTADDCTEYHAILKTHYNGQQGTYFGKMFQAYYYAYVMFVTYLYALCRKFNIDLTSIQVESNQVLLHPKQIEIVTLDYLGYPENNQKADFNRLLTFIDGYTENAHQSAETKIRIELERVRNKFTDGSVFEKTVSEINKYFRDNNYKPENPITRTINGANEVAKAMYQIWKACKDYKANFAQDTNYRMFVISLFADYENYNDQQIKKAMQRT